MVLHRLLKSGTVAIAGAVVLAFMCGGRSIAGQSHDESARRLQQRQKSILLRSNRIEEAAAVDGRVIVRMRAPQSVAQSIDGLVRGASYILIGRFSAGAARVAPHDVVLSEYRLSVEEALKKPDGGATNGSLVDVVIPGGRVGFAGNSFAEVVPQFLLPLPGQRFVAFLKNCGECDNGVGGTVVLRPMLPSWSLYELGPDGKVKPHSTNNGIAKVVAGSDSLEFVRSIREALKGSRP